MFAHWKQRMIWLWALVLLPSTLGLWWAVSTAQAQAPFSINYGETKTGEVVDRLGDEWVFSGCLSDVVTITMQSEIFGSYLELYGPVGRNSLAEAGIEGPNAAAIIGGYVLPESGPFTIIAAAANIRDRGAYSLTLETAGAASASSDQIVGLLGDGDVVTGVVETRLGEEWTIRSCLHDVIAVRMESADFDPYVGVRQPGSDESLVEMNGTDGVAVVEDLILPASGEYIVTAAGASIRDRGAYTLTFTVIERASPEPTPTTTPTGTLTPEATATETSTPVPTATSSSSSGGSSGGSQQPICVVVANLLNLRPGPGTNYTPPIGALARESVVIPLNRNPNTTWIRVQVVPNGPTGWVASAAQYISCNINLTHLPLGVIPPTYTPTPTVYYTNTPTYTPTPTPTYYDTPTYTPTPTGYYETPTYTPTYTPTPTYYYTPTYTPTPTPTYYDTPTYTPTPTYYYTPTYTPTPTPTYYYTATPTPTTPYGGGLPTTGYQIYPPVAHLADLMGGVWVPENYGSNQEPAFHDWISFEAYVYDPMVGNYLGAGIDYVDFAIYPESGGNPLYARREQSERYCVFSGGEPDCNRLKIEQGAKWPGTNTSVNSGRYILVIDAKPSNNGRTGAHWEMYFQVQGGGNGNAQPLYAQVVQTGAGHNNDSVSGALVFQVVAYDPNVGNNDGNGINYVEMQIYEGNHKVYERKENNAAYCAFSGGEPDCQIWYFHDHNNEWPGGEHVNNGQYTLRARVQANSGEEKVIQRQITISN